MNDIANVWVWIGFTLFLIAALSIDTFFLNNKTRPHESMRAALYWSLVWIGCALIFNVFLWLYVYLETSTVLLANQKALEFLTGYLIEKTLSFDNLFAFYMVFNHFRIPTAYQHRVFSYGIWSAIVLRLVLIVCGAWLVSRFHWVLYLMGAFLLLTGIKMCLTREKEKDLSENVILRVIKRFFRITHELHGEHFFIRKNHLLYATPLFITLIFIEISDVVFAFDSIPAIFAITTDPFIVWSSNIFAILGLRALYFLLANMIHRFHLLKYGIALILVFVGGKMLVEPWIHISALLSLLGVITVLILFTLLSILEQRKGKQH